MKLSITEMIEAYITSKQRAWAPTTLRSTRHRLLGLVKVIDGDPERLWRHLDKTAAGRYSRVTVWSNVTSFWEWAKLRGHVSYERNLYPEFRNENTRLFKGAYAKQPAKLTFADARARLSKLEDPAAQKKALEFLLTGMRWIDSERLEDGGTTVGKGGRRRRIAVAEVAGPRFTLGYRTFLRRLAAVGLKPHDLRKILATHLAGKGFNHADLCKIMGWSKFATAESYIAAMHEDTLMERVRAAVKESPNEKVLSGSVQAPEENRG